MCHVGSIERDRGFQQASCGKGQSCEVIIQYLETDRASGDRGVENVSEFMNNPKATGNESL